MVRAQFRVNAAIGMNFSKVGAFQFPRMGGGRAAVGHHTNPPPLAATARVSRGACHAPHGPLASRVNLSAIGY